jgi:glutamyl-tRNA synthetase
MHVGNARIAIVNYLFCRKNFGTFLFRVDDTDLARSQKKYEDAIKENLDWLGIVYDETFKQSEKLERYQEVMEKLISKGILYKCYETQEELEYKRRIATSKGLPPIYDRTALTLSDTEKRKLSDEGIPFYWRFKLPKKTVSWNDLILGEVSYNLNNVSDPVIVKADGTYLYTFSSVVDDFDSNITHIIRGQDHVTNTAIQIAMFDEVSSSKYHVEFAHLSLLVNKDGSQFSKRLGSMSLEDMRQKGIDAMAVWCILATLGSSLDTVPFNKIDDLINYFDISKFSSNSPKFDINDVLKINKKILHSKTFDEIKQWGISEKAYEVIRENISSYIDFQMWNDILKDNYNSTFLPTDLETKLLKIAAKELSKIQEFDEISGQEFLKNVKISTGLSGKELYMPLRKALTDMEHGPNIVQLLTLLGKSEVLRRLNAY